MKGNSRTRNAPIPEDQRRRLDEGAVRRIAVDQRVHFALEGDPVRLHALQADRGRVAVDRAPVDLPHHVPLAVRRLEPGDVDHAPARVVADERRARRGEGARRGRGCRCGDAVVGVLRVCGGGWVSWVEENVG